MEQYFSKAFSTPISSCGSLSPADAIHYPGIPYNSPEHSSVPTAADARSFFQKSVGIFNCGTTGTMDSMLVAGYSRALADAVAYSSNSYAAAAAASAASHRPLGGFASLYGLDPTALYPSLQNDEVSEGWHSMSQSRELCPLSCDIGLSAGTPYSYHGGTSFRGLDTRRKNTTRESTSTLKAWLFEHIKNPYPTKGEKIVLAIITKMTLTQVSTWFANARRRLKKENKMQWWPNKRDEDEDVDNVVDYISDDEQDDDKLNVVDNEDNGHYQDFDRRKQCGEMIDRLGTVIERREQSTRTLNTVAGNRDFGEIRECRAGVDDKNSSSQFLTASELDQKHSNNDSSRGSHYDSYHTVPSSHHPSITCFTNLHPGSRGPVRQVAANTKTHRHSYQSSRWHKIQEDEIYDVRKHRYEDAESGTDGDKKATNNRTERIGCAAAVPSGTAPFRELQKQYGDLAFCSSWQFGSSGSLPRRPDQEISLTNADDNAVTPVAVTSRSITLNGGLYSDMATHAHSSISSTPSVIGGSCTTDNKLKPSAIWSLVEVACSSKT